MIVRTRFAILPCAARWVTGRMQRRAASASVRRLRDAPPPMGLHGYSDAVGSIGQILEYAAGGGGGWLMAVVLLL